MINWQVFFLRRKSCGVAQEHATSYKRDEVDENGARRQKVNEGACSAWEVITLVRWQKFRDGHVSRRLNMIHPGAVREHSLWDTCFPVYSVYFTTCVKHFLSDL